MYILTNNKLYKDHSCPICNKYTTECEVELIETTTYDDKFKTFEVKAIFYYHENMTLRLQVF